MPHLPPDAVLFYTRPEGHDYWAAKFEPVGDVMIPRRVYVTLTSKYGRSVSDEEDFPTFQRMPEYSGHQGFLESLLVEKLNLMSENTRRVWVVGRILRDSIDPGIKLAHLSYVPKKEWYEMTGLSEHDFEQSLKVLLAIRYTTMARRSSASSPYYFISGLQVTPLEIVALE